MMLVEEEDGPQVARCRCCGVDPDVRELPWMPSTGSAFLGDNPRHVAPRRVGRRRWPRFVLLMTYLTCFVRSR